MRPTHIVLANVIATIAALCVCSSLTASAQSFAPPVLYSTGGAAPQGVAIGDLNRDGKLDVVVTNSEVNGTIGVLLGNGDGTLRPAVTYAAGSYPGSIVLADFNHDGFLDVAVANRAIGTPGQVNILLGKGDGTFEPAVAYGPFTDAFSIVKGDVNQDHNLDIVVGDVGQGSLLLGKGDGTFTLGQPIGGTNAVAFAVADFNGDGRPDLVCADNSGSQVQLFVGNGKGGFTLQSTYRVSTPPIAIVAGDFNGDGVPDFAIAGEAVNNKGSNVTVFESSAKGYVGKKYPYGDEPRFITTTKFIRHGSLYLVIANEFNGTIDLFRRMKNGSFTKPVVIADGAPVAAYMAVGDLNRDGKTDLVVADGFVDGKIRVLLQK